MLTVKIIVDLGKPKFLKLPSKNLKQQWLMKLKRRKIQSIYYARMCHYCFG